MSRVIDLRLEGNHPLLLRYSEIYDAALVETDIMNFRVQPSIVLNSHASGFYRAAKKSSDFGVFNDGALELIVSELSDFYNAYQPENISEWFSIEGSSVHRDNPPWASVYPWRARTLESYREAHENGTLSENTEYGYGGDILDGWSFCGPTSKDKVIVESKRILSILKSISTDGYVRSNLPDGDIRATALVDENNNWRLLITSGNHRAAVLAALGYEKIVSRVNLVISIADLNYWRHVREGLYTPAQAKDIFYQVFYGRECSE